MRYLTDPIVVYSQVEAALRSGASFEIAAESAGLDADAATALTCELRPRINHDPFLAGRVETLVTNALTAWRCAPGDWIAR